MARPDPLSAFARPIDHLPRHRGTAGTRIVRLRGWSVRGTDAQKENKAAVVGIVNYCARQAFAQIGEVPRDLENFPSQAAAARESYNHATLTTWRLCEGAEADAYSRVILQGALTGVDQQIVKACTAIPDSESYAAIERCVHVEVQIRK